VDYISVNRLLLVPVFIRAKKRNAMTCEHRCVMAFRFLALMKTVVLTVETLASF